MKKQSFLNVLMLALLCGLTLSLSSCGDDKDEDILGPGGSSSISKYEAVDLGLSVKWATCNLGSSTPEGGGLRYAWGETELKDEYTEGNYKFKENGKYTKYCNSRTYGIYDLKTQLEVEDDAARANMGGKWRIPSYDEFVELKNKCVWGWTKFNDIEGFKIVGPNGNSIFLPVTGNYRMGHYWTSTATQATNSSSAYQLEFGPSAAALESASKYSPLPIRPVTE